MATRSDACWLMGTIALLNSRINRQPDLAGSGGVTNGILRNDFDVSNQTPHGVKHNAIQAPSP